MPDAVGLTMVSTGLTSTLLMAIYSAEEIAEEACEKVDRLFKENKYRVLDVIAFHGKVFN